jgi:hypothetical protein
MPKGIYHRSPEYRALLAERLRQRQTPEMKANAALATHLARTNKKYAYRGLKAIHRERAEHALGRPLPIGAVVHHADGSKKPDAPLVICQDTAYHCALHVRMRVRERGGNPWTDKICSACRAIKPKTAFTKDRSSPEGLAGKCTVCRVALARLRRARKLISA